MTLSINLLTEFLTFFLSFFQFYYLFDFLFDPLFFYLNLRKEEERNKHVIGLFRRPFSYIEHFCFFKRGNFPSNLPWFSSILRLMLPTDNTRYFGALSIDYVQILLKCLHLEKRYRRWESSKSVVQSYYCSVRLTDTLNILFFYISLTN